MIWVLQILRRYDIMMNKNAYSIRDQLTIFVTIKRILSIVGSFTNWGRLIKRLNNGVQVQYENCIASFGAMWGLRKLCEKWLDARSGIQASRVTLDARTVWLQRTSRDPLRWRTLWVTCCAALGRWRSWRIAYRNEISALLFNEEPSRSRRRSVLSLRRTRVHVTIERGLCATENWDWGRRGNGDEERMGCKTPRRTGT